MKILAAVDGDDLRRALRGIAEGSAEIFFVAVASELPLDQCDALFLEWRPDHNAAPVLEALRKCRSARTSKPVIVFVPKGDHALFRRAISAGATDVLYSPPGPYELAAEIRGLDARELDLLDPEARRHFEHLRQTVLVGVSHAFCECLERVKRAATTDANVLLVGETGVGKDVMAQAIHSLSRRRNERFEAVNCAHLEGTLATSELFGHVRGAFTGADRNRDGWFATVGAGTLFLDEIGDLDLGTQVKLLRAVEQRTFHKLGDTASHQFHGRLLSATLKDPDAAVAARSFREDLLARIDQYRITVPPLRERRTDIRLLAWHFVKKHSRGRALV